MGLFGDCPTEEKIPRLKRVLDARLLTCDPTSGAFFGTPLDHYLEDDSWRRLQGGCPIRTFADAVVIEVAATDEECLAIVDQLRPTDFVRFPGEDNWLFCWYTNPGDYPKLWKVNRKAGAIKRRLTLEEAGRQEALDLLNELNASTRRGAPEETE